MVGEGDDVRIGYPCINRSIGCSANRTFRLASYSDERLLSTVRGNLECLERILSFNAAHHLLFFRITSDLVPFASHPVCTAPWQEELRPLFARVGALAGRGGFRISMHPDQFVLINSPDPALVERSVAELSYHAAVLDLMDLDGTAKMQIHVGGVYGDRKTGMDRFTRVHGDLPEPVIRRLVVENDDSRYSLRDCLEIHGETGIPVVYDHFHHRCHGDTGEIHGILGEVAGTWTGKDGIPMADYSSQEPGRRPGTHATALDPDDFRAFLSASSPRDMDVMLEIKDKERSALAAAALARRDPRFKPGNPVP
ncbi:MAG: UV DNA damage repair endonuclease UvsE [Methanomicrobiales archaeon]|nr:UV DNA damage repair endonuclease UvsE [Methanomicrobiales archaeon]